MRFGLRADPLPWGGQDYTHRGRRIRTDGIVPPTAGSGARDSGSFSSSPRRKSSDDRWMKVTVYIRSRQVGNVTCTSLLYETHAHCTRLPSFASTRQPPFRPQGDIDITNALQ
ncbi:hypothetical protein LshimejAT787_0600320 [Lyophyllum shimeji]|uniref:Uncharacterized protein n=1 Tax=Lyophyllum shimeji TaxID=47721 RepID=A0A9P3PN01_LYOSH|nr:hypothetical protein LshimejAT787_0600320 [Lyophyllum shimeji]